jgi:molecular chaperone GrpE
MLNREELFDNFLHYLQMEQEPPEFLGNPPESPSNFDPYQMVGEWIALRQEVKQQNKILRSAQDTLQQALLDSNSDKEQLHLYQTNELATFEKRFEQEQEKLLLDMLGILDSLDRACEHWQEQIQDLSIISTLKPEKQNFWGKLGNLFSSNNSSDADDVSVDISTSLNDILTSNQQGVELIRRSLLQILRQRRVVPIEALGKPFDSQIMYAIARQENAEVVENTVIQEVVRGYLWGDRVLREAQVIVGSGELKIKN